MKIDRIETVLLKFPSHVPKVPSYSVNPAHCFEDMRPGGGGGGGGNRPHMAVLRVWTDEGLMGVANTNVGAGPVARVIEEYLAPLVMGRDPLAVEELWERMYRATLPLGRQGINSTALSLVDIALWDIRGKAMGQPVYRLLGGGTGRMRVYASRLYGPDMGLLREEAARYVEEGYTAVKQRLAYGPAAGLEGMRKNRALVEAVRDAVGDGVELMVDCCRAFDADYAVGMLKMLEEFGLGWAEEPVLPHDHEGYARVRRAVDMPIAGGEHEYERQTFGRWARDGCADIWQPDANRAGGITECQKIAHLAAAHGIAFVPHGGQLHNYHVIAANANAPLAEYFPRQEAITDGNAFYWYITQDEPEPVEGYLEIPQRPGLGLELDEAALKRYRFS